MFRDTSAQDRTLSPARWRGRRVALVAAAVAVALAFALPMLARQLAAGQSVSQARLGFAEVQWGPLVRDVAGEGKVVAAVSPTLYAGSAGTVSLLVQAGEAVQRDQVLARIASAELSAKLAQERSNADALIGRLSDRVHVLCFVETADGIRVISFRKANARRDQPLCQSSNP